MKQIHDTEHFIELMLLYDTTAAEELIEAMQSDIAIISKNTKPVRKDDGR